MFALKRSFTMVKPNTAALVRTPVAFLSNFDDKRKGEEKSYFSKQDAKLLKKLVEKMEKNNEEEVPAAAAHACLVDDLADIFDRHKMEKDGKHSLLW